MSIILKRAVKSDCEQIHKRQLEAFKQLLEKYTDYETNPGAEPLEKIKQRMEQAFTHYYFIQFENQNIGVIRIAMDSADTCRIAPIFILPAYQNKGYAQEAIKQVELLYPRKRWILSTIKQEEKLCHLYEKLGYQATGSERIIQENMSLRYYEK